MKNGRQFVKLKSNCKHVPKHMLNILCYEMEQAYSTLD